MKIDAQMKLPSCPHCSRQIAQDVIDNICTYDGDYIRWRCFCGEDFCTTTIMKFVTDRDASK